MKRLSYIILMLTISYGKVSAQPSYYPNAYYLATLDTTYFGRNATSYEYFDYNAYISQSFWKVTTILPTNTAMRSFVDPVSYYYMEPQMWVFADDASKSLAQRLSAGVYNYTIDENGVPTATTRKTLLTGTSNTYVKNRLEFILNNSIIMETLQKGKQYYKTRGNSFVRIEENGSKYTVSGTLFSQPTEATAYEVGNGLALAVNGPIVPNSKSVAHVLSEHPEFSDFLWVLQASGALSWTNTKDRWIAGDQTYGNLLNIKSKGMIGAEEATSNYKVTYLLDSFHYTIYAPTNDAMQQAFAAGLPNPEKLAEAERLDDRENLWGTAYTHTDSLIEVLLDFVKYHVQDNSVFVDEGFTSGNYATAKNEIVHNTEGNYIVGTPYKVNVNVSGSKLTVTDAMGNTRNVVTTKGLHNIMAQEYWSSATSPNTNPYSATLDNSSFVVIHAIDGPLFYDAPNQFKYEYKKLYQDSSYAKQF